MLHICQEIDNRTSCCRTASTEQAADRAEAAVVDHYFLWPTENISVRVCLSTRASEKFSEALVHSPSHPYQPLHVLLSLPIPNPFLAFTPPYKGYTVGSGDPIAPPAGPGSRTWPPNAFWCNSEPKLANLLKFHPRAQKKPYNIL